MRKILAVVLVGLGLALIGVALGLLYIDYRNEQALHLAIEAGIPEAAHPPAAESAASRLLPTPAEPADEKSKAIQAIQKWADPAPIVPALLSGSLGAGFLGAGLLLALMELSIFRRKV